MDDKVLSEAVTSKSDWLDLTSKAGALSLIAIYSLGYLITSLHAASYGMGVANPLKPRTAAAGVLFCLLVGIPIWLSELIVRSEQISVVKALNGHFGGLVLRFTHLLHVCFLIALPLTLLFDYSGSGGWRTALIIGLITAESAFVAASGIPKVDEMIARHIKLTVILYLLLLMTYVSLLATALWSQRFTWLQIPSWLFACGVYVQGIRPKMGQPLKSSWPTVLAQSLAPLLIFSTFLYPHIKSGWGGGQPIQVVVRFTKDSAIFSAQKAQCELIEETDAGLYLIYGNQKHILFVPRANIAALVYSDSAKDMP